VRTYSITKIKKSRDTAAAPAVVSSASGSDDDMVQLGEAKILQNLAIRKANSERFTVRFDPDDFTTMKISMKNPFYKHSALLVRALPCIGG